MLSAPNPSASSAPGSGLALGQLHRATPPPVSSHLVLRPITSNRFQQAAKSSLLSWVLHEHCHEAWSLKSASYHICGTGLMQECEEATMAVMVM